MKNKVHFTKFLQIKPIIGFILLLSVVLMTVKAEELIVALDDSPPWTIINKKPYRGIDVDIINMLAADLSLTVNFVTCPFKLCLALMESGDVDLMPGLLKTPAREKYMVFIKPAYFYDPPKIFYLNKENPKQIHRYEDLKDLTIGVNRGVSYFEKFDNDKALKKFIVTKELQLLKLLKIGRIDTFISTESIADYLIATEGFLDNFIKAPFHYGNGDVSYLAISKKSAFLQKIDIFQKSVKKSVENNAYNNLADDFYKNTTIKSK